jgi:putative membrane protein
MHRRTLVMAGAAALLASPAFAQSLNSGAAQAGPAETKHRMDTKRIGTLSLALSRVAVEKAQNPAVKEFAQFEVAEQETVAAVLKSWEGAPATTGTGAPTNAQINQELDAKGKAALEKLQAAKAGPEFDRQYVQDETGGHQDLLKVQESYLNAGRMREEVNVAKLIRGMVQEHLKLLDDAQKKLG